MSMPGVPLRVKPFDIDASKIYTPSLLGAPDAAGVARDVDGRRVLVQFLRGPMGKSRIKANNITDRILHRLAEGGGAVGAFIGKLGQLDSDRQRVLARALSYSGDRTPQSAGQRLDNRATLLILAAEGIDVDALLSIRKNILDRTDLKAAARLGEIRYVTHVGKVEKPGNRRQNLEAHANATLKTLLTEATARELRPALVKAIIGAGQEHVVYPATEIVRQVFAQGCAAHGQSAHASQLVNQVGLDVQLARDLDMRRGRKELDKMLDKNLDTLPEEYFDRIYEKVLDKLGPGSALALKIQLLSPNIASEFDEIHP